MTMNGRPWRSCATSGYAALLAACLGALAGCDGTIAADSTGMGAGGNGSGGAGSGGSAPIPEGCDAAPTVVPRRMVRLDFHQVENSMLSLMGPDSLTGVPRENPREREFQQLFYEGRLISTDVLRKTVTLGEVASGSIASRYATFTGCAAGDDACAQNFVLAFAEKAFRRPVTEEEKTSLRQLYTETKALYTSSPSAGIEEAVRYGLEGAMVAPAAVYRTEFGAPAAGATETPLTPHETASLLSYFLLNGPPDQPLLDAARSGQLSTPEGVTAEVGRLLQTEPVKANLTKVLVAYYRMKDLDTVTKDPGIFPEFTGGMQNSMYAGTELFLGDNVRNGKVNDLLSSRRYFINENLANLYGITYPGPPGGDFMPVEMAAGERAGLLTQAGILAMRARTDNTSVVARGLFVNGTVLCIPATPPPPASVQPNVDAQLADTTQTERQKADYRAMTQPCGGCHSLFDPYGLVLENYDGIGKFRTQYPNGTPIDTSGTLPAQAGGVPVANVIDLVDTVTQNGAFTRCMTANLLKYALTEASLIDYADCGIDLTHEAFQATAGQTFNDLAREVALSKTVSVRRVE
jgi:hypothetical protein